MEAVKLQTTENNSNTVEPGDCFTLDNDAANTRTARLAFIKMVKRASKQMGTKDVRLDLCSMRIKSDGEKLHLYTTDGYVLCHISSDYAPPAHIIAETLGKFDYAIGNNWAREGCPASKISDLVKSEKILISNSMVIFEGKRGEMIDFQHLPIGPHSSRPYFPDVSAVYPVKRTDEWGARFFTSKHKGDKQNIKTNPINALDCILKALNDLHDAGCSQDSALQRVNLATKDRSGAHAHAVFQLIDPTPAFTGCAVGASNADLEFLRERFHWVGKNEAPFFIAAIDNESYTKNSAPKVAIDAKYLLSAIEGEAVTIRFGKALEPITVEVEGCTTVINPVRL